VSGKHGEIHMFTVPLQFTCTVPLRLIRHMFYLAEDILAGYRDEVPEVIMFRQYFRNFRHLKDFEKCLRSPQTVCYLHDQTCNTCDKPMVHEFLPVG